MQDYKEFLKKLFDAMREEDNILRNQSEAALMVSLQSDFIDDEYVILNKTPSPKFFVNIIDELEEKKDRLNSKQIYSLLKKECIKHDALTPFQPSAKWGKVKSERQWIINDWIPRANLGILAGQGGVGKSTLILQLCAALSSGSKDWIKLYADRNDKINQMNRTNFTTPKKVVFCSYEDEEDEIDRRLQKISKEHPFAKAEKINGNFHYIDCTKLGSIWLPAGSSQHISTIAAQTRVGEKIQKFCEKIKAEILILDPLAAAYGSEENSRALVRAFMTFWLGWARETKCTVLIISHEPKNVNEDYRISGSTDWYNASRFVLHLGLNESKVFGVKDRQLITRSAKTEKAKGLKLTLVKSNYGRNNIQHWMKILDNQAGLIVCTEEESCYQIELARGNINEIEESKEIDPEYENGDEPM